MGRWDRHDAQSSGAECLGTNYRTYACDRIDGQYFCGGCQQWVHVRADGTRPLHYLPNDHFRRKRRR